MDTAPERYALNVASATAAVSGLRLAGAYLHGSAVLGGFDARRSDVDVLVVCDGPMTAAQQSAAAEALSEQRLPCPRAEAGGQWALERLRRPDRELIGVRAAPLRPAAGTAR